MTYKNTELAVFIIGILTISIGIAYGPYFLVEFICEYMGWDTENGHQVGSDIVIISWIIVLLVRIKQNSESPTDIGEVKTKEL